MKLPANDDHKFPLLRALKMNSHAGHMRPHLTRHAIAENGPRAHFTGRCDPAARWRLFERDALF